MATGAPRPQIEFRYRLPRRAAGWRPGAHAGTALGAGMEFVSHMALRHWPDPRRLDLRASLRQPGGEWLVRVSRQRAATTALAVVDVSASMAFGRPQRKLDVAADLLDALGASSFRLGDMLGLAAFDGDERDDLFMPPMRGRAAGSLMAERLRQCEARNGAPGAGGLLRVAQRWAGRQALVFLVSDFHWPLDLLAPALDCLSHAFVVPVVVWDPAETEVPAPQGLAFLRDAETPGVRRTLWMRPALQRRWQAAVDLRRAQLAAVFGARGLHPLHLTGRFDPEAMSRHFIEAFA